MKSTRENYAIIQILVLKEKVKTNKGIIKEFFLTGQLLKIWLRSNIF